jgi:hypothetical protein
MKNRVNGHIMVIEENGTIKVRVRHPSHELDGRKLTVREVRSGTILGKGDEVHFLVQQGRTVADATNYYATDVALFQKDEGGQGLSNLVGKNSLLGIAGIKQRSGEVYYDVFSFPSRKELQQWFDDAGGGDKVLFYVRITEREIELANDDEVEEPSAEFQALTALLRLDSFRFAFNHVIARVAEAVLKTANQRRSSEKPVVLAIDDRPEEIQALFAKTLASGQIFEGYIHEFKDINTAFEEVLALSPDITLVGHGLSAGHITGADVVKSFQENGEWRWGGIVAGNSGGGKDIWVRDRINLRYYVDRDPKKLGELLGLLELERKEQR